MHVNGDTPQTFGLHTSIYLHPTTILESVPCSHTIFGGSIDCMRAHSIYCAACTASFQKLQRLQKSILQSHFKNKGPLWPGAASGRPQGAVKRKRTLPKGKWWAANPRGPWATGAIRSLALGNVSFLSSSSDARARSQFCPKGCSSGWPR